MCWGCCFVHWAVQGRGRIPRLFCEVGEEVAEHRLSGVAGLESTAAGPCFTTVPPPVTSSSASSPNSVGCRVLRELKKSYV